ncbi:hypothetical protein GN244_ATG02869 [Phytophthora infestans]|uniref:Uncharacterized protein n=1 Tax=Phytophthora infestans TaxID=4787 RepID=A0A833T0A9_PHYIN|nr:hypothetical protein GN244_ATG02869 [Phytophthora infestans]
MYLEVVDIGHVSTSTAKTPIEIAGDVKLGLLGADEIPIGNTSYYPEDGSLMIDSEERTKYGSLKDVIKRSTAAEILKDIPSDSVRKMVKAVKYNSELTKKEEEVVNALLALAAKA